MRLTNKQIDKVVTLLEAEITMGAIALQLEISPNQVSKIKKAKGGNFNGIPSYIVDYFTQLEEKEEIKQPEKPISAGEIHPQHTKRNKLSGNRFVFTSAQNNTNIHADFLASLLTYCKHNDSQLVIAKFAYNKNGFQNLEADSNELHYDPSLKDYFITESMQVTNGLVWCGELNILPTAKFPLSGLEQYTQADSCIIPHAKISLESIATRKHEPCKMMYSTGCVTQRNYIQKKAGQTAEPFHCYGALIVEIDENGEWFARQIQADETGEFQDLTTIYTPDDIRLDCEIEAINWGDFHAEKADNEIIEACFGFDGLLDILRPQHQFVHDCLDMTSRNHHNRKSGHFLADMHYKGQESVQDDINKTLNLLEKTLRDYSTTYVVESNHDLALLSWLDANDYDYKKDPINALTYLRLQTAYYTALQEGQSLNLLEYCYLNRSDTIDSNQEELIFLETDQSLLVADIECGIHGHIGANGSRGNPKQFMKLNTPANTGHTHSASIYGKVYTAGVTGSLEMGYNKGPSSWSHSHIVTYPNSMRTIITMKKTTNGVKWYA